MHRLSAELKARGGTRSNHFFYDMLGVHPYTGGAGVGFDPALPAGSRAVQTTTGEKNMTFRGVERVRAQVAADEGIWRNVVIGEFGYDTEAGKWYYSPEPQRSAYLTSALRISSTWSWMKGMTVYGWSRSSGDGFRVTGTASEAAIRALTSR
jgi:hypothetical protein